MPLGCIFAQIIKDERSIKVVKIIFVHWRFTFLWRGQVCFSMHLFWHYTFVWEKCWEFQTTSPLKPLGQCCSNFMWSLLRLEEWKIANMVAVHWPSWPPCPYMVKTLKSSPPEQRIPWGWIFAQIIRDGRSTKAAKMMVVHLRLTFVRLGQVCFPMHWYGHYTSPLKPLGQRCSSLMWSHLRLGEQKIAKMVAVHWLRWLPWISSSPEPNKP